MTWSDPARPVLAGKSPRLLDLFRQTIRARHYSRRTEKAYAGWIKRYVFFHAKRHPRDMGVSEVTQFLSSLATDGHVSASTQNQAFSALLFLYRLCSAEHKRGYVAAAAMWRSGRNLLRVADQ